MATSWGKVDSDLDNNRKVLKAGNLGRQVFEFVLRRVAHFESQGRIPATELEPWYVGKKLMFEGTPEANEAMAQQGIDRAVSAKLIAFDDEEVVVVGWDDEWGRRPQTNAERQANHRAKKSAKLTDPSPKQLSLPSAPYRDADYVVTEAPLLVTTNNACNGSEESRSDLGDRSVSDLTVSASGSGLSDTRERVQPPPPARTVLTLVPLSPEPEPAPALPPEPEVARRIAWWQAMLAAHDDLRRRHGIEPDAPDLPPAPGTVHDENLDACEAYLRSAGYADADFDAKFMHVITLRTLEARVKRTLKFFAPSTMFRVENFARTCDMTMAAVMQKPEPPGPRPPPRPPRSRSFPPSSAPSDAPMTDAERRDALERARRAVKDGRAPPDTPPAIHEQHAEEA